MSDQGTLTPLPFWQVIDSDGAPIDGALLYTYEAGTTTPQSVYSDPDLDPIHALTNPVEADSAGRFPPIYLAQTSYRFVLKTSAGVTIKTIDPVGSVPTSNVNPTVIGFAGESLTAGDGVYVSQGDGGRTPGYWYKWDADNSYSSSEAALIGFAVDDITATMSGSIQIGGQFTTAVSLTAGTLYYVSATAGALTTTSTLSNSRQVGVADSTTTILITGNGLGSASILNLLQIEALLG